MILGVIGGMGPMATVDFLNKLVSLTKAKNDSEHIHTIIDSHCEIPDRSNFILKGGSSPLDEIILSVQKLEKMGADILVMPCNTAHFFSEDIKRSTNLPFINMIEETASFLKNTFKTKEKIGLLSTKGTYHSSIYEKTFDNYGIGIIRPSEEIINLVSDIIYKVKEGTYEEQNYLKELEGIIHFFESRGINKVVLGCTELPLVFKNLNKTRVNKLTFIDPTEILARSAIIRTGRLIKETHSSHL